MSYSETAALNAIFGILGTFWLLVVAYFVISIIANWKIFTKAGQPGWAAIVPFYKQYIEFKIYWGNGWLFLVPIVLAALAFVRFSVNYSSSPTLSSQLSRSTRRPFLLVKALALPSVLYWSILSST